MRSTAPAAPPPAPEVSWPRLLGRGAIKRCPRCGAKHLYRGWFRMVERCPGCGLRFEREPGFFVGAYLINFAVAIIVLFVICMIFVAMKAVDHDAPLAPVMIPGLVIALVVPIVFYPYARTIWSAFDIGMTPIEPEEAADAAAALARGDVGRVVRAGD